MAAIVLDYLLTKSPTQCGAETCGCLGQLLDLDGCPGLTLGFGCLSGATLWFLVDVRSQLRDWNECPGTTPWFKWNPGTNSVIWMKVQANLFILMSHSCLSIFFSKICTPTLNIDVKWMPGGHRPVCTPILYILLPHSNVDGYSFLHLLWFICTYQCLFPVLKWGHIVTLYL